MPGGGGGGGDDDDDCGDDGQWSRPIAAAGSRRWRLDDA